MSLAPVVIAAKMHSNLKRFVSKEGASSSGVSENSLSCSYGLGVTDITGVGLLVSLPVSYTHLTLPTKRIV